MNKPGKNLILLVDSYKLSHWLQYPPGTQRVYSYLESRGGDFPEVVFIGLQMLLQRLQGVAFTRADIDRAERLANKHVGPGVFNRKGWDDLYNKYGGRLPIIIKAIPEGTPVPVGMPLLIIENTDPEFYWLTNYLETYLSQVWYPSTVATISREIKKVIGKYLTLTGGIEGLPFKLHDFGFRGVSSIESAGIGGCAHLVNFMGTDTVVALEYVEYFYDTNIETAIAGYSIPAAEHSTITSWGKENEVQAFNNMLEKYPTGLVAVVSDSFNIYDACKNLWGKELKDKVLNRDGVLIIRPDSGNPVEVVEKVVTILGEVFGYTVNDKGFKVLNPKVRVIQGDGVDKDSITAILERLMVNGWSAENVAFGMGGALLQKLNRDTQKFAFKCSSVTVNGTEKPVYKQPVDTPWKKSKSGRLITIKTLTEDGFKWEVATDNTELHTHQKNMLETVFQNGEIVKRYTFDEVRKNAEVTF